MVSNLICDPAFKVAGKVVGLKTLEFTVLDWFSSQVVIHLNGKDGCCCTFILGAIFT